MSSDDEQFEDTYDSIEEEEAIEPLEVEGATTIQSTMPSGDENKPPKSIFKAMTTHLSLLKGRVSELMLSKSDTRSSAMSGIAGFMSCSFMKLIYQKFSCISVLSQAELGMQLKTQLNWDQNCIFTEWNELDVRSAMFGMAEFWVSDFESIRRETEA